MKAHNRPIKRRVPGQMSQTEIRFSQILDEMLKREEITHYLYEPITFKLAEGLRYTPDFMCVYSKPALGTAFFEIKGSEFFASGKSNQMNSLSKLKMTATKFSQFYFYKCFPRKKSEGGEWVIEPVKI